MVRREPILDAQMGDSGAESGVALPEEKPGSRAWLLVIVYYIVWGGAERDLLAIVGCAALMSGIGARNCSTMDARLRDMPATSVVRPLQGKQYRVDKQKAVCYSRAVSIWTM